MSHSQFATAMRSKLNDPTDWDAWWHELTDRTPKTIVKLFSPQTEDEPLEEPERPIPGDVVPGAQTLHDLDRDERKLFNHLQTAYTIDKAVYESQVDRLIKVRELIQGSVGESLRPSFEPAASTRGWIVALQENSGMTPNKAIDLARARYHEVRNEARKHPLIKATWVPWLQKWEVAMASIIRVDASESIGSLWVDDLADAIEGLSPVYGQKLRIASVRGITDAMTYRSVSREIRKLLK